MKFSNKFKDTILNKSDKYNFYKEEYEKLKKIQKDLKKENSHLKKIIKQDYIIQNNNFNFEEFLIKSYHAPFFNAPFSSAEKRCFEFMDVIADYLIKNVDKIEEKPLISVIMPVYNRKDIVLDSINSVLNQSYENFELIIVDDASDDGTAELLKEIDNNKIKVIFHEINQDASAARNTALKEANGKYIAYLDSDNLFEKDYLKASIGAFLEFPDAGAIYSAQKRYDFHDSELSQVLFGHLNKSSLFNQNCIDINCFVHKKEVLNEIGYFDEELAIGEDWDFILKINNKYKIYSIPFLLSKYYFKAANNRKLVTTPSNREKIYRNCENLLRNIPNLNKKVTVIIPIYSNDENLMDCLNSILSFDLDNIEIIVSNNNSNINLDYLNHDNVKVLNSKTNLGFVDALNQAILFFDSSSDVLILNQNAIIEKGSIELMQKYSSDLYNSGLIVSNHLIKNSKLINKYAPHVHEDYWFDITTVENIMNIPLFFNGEVLSLKYSPFFCTYIREDVWKNIINLDLKCKNEDDFMFFLSEYTQKVLNLKIYYVSDVNVYDK